MLATIYVLCYGNYIDLHRRLFSSLAARLPTGEARVVVWGNQLGDRSLDYVWSSVRSFNDHWFNASSENVPKYKVMRQLWHGVGTAPTTPWILWLDDDTYITQPDWWRKTSDFLRSKEDASYVGQIWYVHHLPGQWEFISKSSWFKGKPPEQVPTRKKGVTQPGVKFATGSYVWLKTDVMKQLDWPDARLNHNGGDTLLGEAVRQLGLPRYHYDYGVMVNKAKRRGFHEKPAGSDVNVRR